MTNAEMFRKRADEYRAAATRITRLADLEGEMAARNGMSGDPAVNLVRRVLNDAAKELHRSREDWERMADDAERNDRR